MSNIYGQALSLTHIVVGACALLTPAFTVDLFGVPPTPAIVARLVGSRDLAVGYSIWASSPHTRRSAIMIANMINALDIISGLISYAQGDLSDRALLLGTGTGVLSLGLGILALRNEPLV